MFLSRGDRDLGVAFQTHPGRQAFISSGSKEPRSALESRRVSLGAHWVDSRESSLLRRLERGRRRLAFLSVGDGPAHSHRVTVRRGAVRHLDAPAVELAVEAVERLLDALEDRVRPGELAAEALRLHLVD